MATSLPLFLLKGIPEVIGVLFLALVLSRKRFEWAKLIILGICMTFIVYVLRENFVFGVHSLISLVLQVMIINYFFKVKLITAVKSILISLVILFVGETVFMELLALISGIQYQEAISRPVLWTLWALPQVLTLWLIGGIILWRRSRKQKANPETRNLEL